MSNFLEVMMRLRNARNLDARQSGLVDSAYFAVRAADRAVKRKQRPPQHEYIRYLVYERLPLGQVTKVGGEVGRWAEEHSRAACLMPLGGQISWRAALLSCCGALSPPASFNTPQPPTFSFRRC